MSAESPFAVPKLLAFAESKPADEMYDYGEPRNCALGQYVQSIGGEMLLPDEYNGCRYKIGALVFSVIDGRVLGQAKTCSQETPRTFGALATRLRAALKDERT